MRIGCWYPCHQLETHLQITPSQGKAVLYRHCLLSQQGIPILLQTVHRQEFQFAWTRGNYSILQYKSQSHTLKLLEFKKSVHHLLGGVCLHMLLSNKNNVSSTNLTSTKVRRKFAPALCASDLNSVLFMAFFWIMKHYTCVK